MLQILNGPEPDRATWAIFSLFAVGVSAYAGRQAARESDAFRRSQMRRFAVVVLVIFGGLGVWQAFTHSW